MKTTLPSPNIRVTRFEHISIVCNCVSRVGGLKYLTAPRKHMEESEKCNTQIETTDISWLCFSAGLHAVTLRFLSQHVYNCFCPKNNRNDCCALNWTLTLLVFVLWKEFYKWHDMSFLFFKESMLKSSWWLNHKHPTTVYFPHFTEHVFEDENLNCFFYVCHLSVCAKATCQIFLSETWSAFDELLESLLEIIIECRVDDGINKRV